MSEHSPLTDAGRPSARHNGRGIRYQCSSALAILLLLRAAEVFAGDTPIIDVARPGDNDSRPSAALSASPFLGPQLSGPQSSAADLSATQFSAPQFSATQFSTPQFSATQLSAPLFSPPRLYGMGTYPIPELNETDNYPVKDFRPRGRSVFETAPRGNPADENLEFDQTIWQRMNEYRTRNRIRVLTLWESGASTVSLQTTTKGGPSLQWTSRLMNHGGASHGVLDDLFPVSVLTGSGDAHSVGRSAGPSPAKPVNPLGSLHTVTSAMP